MRTLCFITALFISVCTSAQSSVNFALSVGTDIVQTKGILFEVYGQYLGSQNELAITVAPKISATGEFRYRNILFGIGLSCMAVPYRNLVHRYSVYYSPGGNAYGGHIYETYSGNYLALEIPAHVDYYFMSREKFRIGATCSATRGQIGPVKTETRKSYFLTGGGLALEWNPHNFHVTVRSQALFTTYQQKDFFYPFGAILDVTFSTSVWNREVQSK